MFIERDVGGRTKCGGRASRGQGRKGVQFGSNDDDEEEDEEEEVAVGRTLEQTAILH